MKTVESATELRLTFNEAQRAAWNACGETLGNAERERFREVMAGRLDAFVLQIVNKVGWWGSAFYEARNRCLLEALAPVVLAEVAVGVVGVSGGFALNPDTFALLWLGTLGSGQVLG